MFSSNKRGVDILEEVQQRATQIMKELEYHSNSVLVSRVLKN